MSSGSITSDFNSTDLILNGGMISNSEVSSHSVNTCAESLLLDSCPSTWRLSNSVVNFIENGEFESPEIFEIIDTDEDSELNFYFKFRSDAPVFVDAYTTVTLFEGGLIDGSVLFNKPFTFGDLNVSTSSLFEFDHLYIDHQLSLSLFDSFTSGNLVINGSLVLSGTSEHTYNLTLDTRSIVKLSLSNPGESDQFHVSGHVDYNGTLLVSHPEDVEYPGNTLFYVIRHDSFSGSFSKYSGFSLVHFEPLYDDSAMVLFVGRDTSSGDGIILYVGPEGIDSRWCGFSTFDPCKTIDATLDKVVEGDSLVLLPGVYHPETPLSVAGDSVFTNITGQDFEIHCNDKVSIGFEASHERVLFSDISFVGCVTAIKSDSSSLSISNISVSSQSKSSAARVLDSFLSFADISESQISSLTSPLFNLQQLSSMILSDSSIDHCQSETHPMFYSRSSTMSLTSSSFSSVGSILDSSSSRISIDNCHITLLSSNTSVMSFVLDTVSMTSMSVSDSVLASPLISASHSSITVNDVMLDQLSGDYPHLIYSFKNKLSLSNAMIRDINSFTLSLSSFLNISNTSFNNVNPKDSSLFSMYKSDSLFDDVSVTEVDDAESIISSIRSSLSIVNSFFAEVSVSLSVVNISSSKNTPFINSTTFEQCHSSFSGAALVSIDPIIISYSRFVQNTATCGGALVLSDSSTVTNCIFSSNSVSKNGGAIFYYSIKDVVLLGNSLISNQAMVGGAIFTSVKNLQLDTEQNLFGSNDATNYGNDIASLPTKLSVHSANGQTVTFAVLDSFDQEVVDLNSHQIFLLPSSRDFALKGAAKTPLYNGRVTFSSLSVMGSHAMTHEVVALAEGLMSANTSLNISTCDPNDGMGIVDGICVPCPIGFFAYDGICKKCPVGKSTSSIGYSSCTPCPAGTKKDEDSLTCTRCPLGSFSDEEGSGECKKCGSRRASSEDFTSCVCDGNLFLTDGECERCPQGLVCDAYETFCVLEGFYITPDQTVVQCKKSGCQGNCTEDSAVCFENFEGPLCSYCKTGYYPQGDQCSECPRVIWMIIGVASQIAFYVACVPLILQDKKKSMFENLAFYLTWVRFLQALCAIRTITAIPFPSFVHYVFDFIDMIVLRPVGSPVAGCLGLPSSFNSLFWSSTALLPLIVLCGYILRSTEISSALFQLFLAVPAHNLLSIFSCRSIDESVPSFSPLL
ncbi:hypothetical protein GEMRC1_009318 [Eukaryota sp. GEM-RC1]